jgi:YrbI family 3-deoxy-D-manno-octulosonate 8-phosphate phosphatase
MTGAYRWYRYPDEQREALRTANVKDGYALQLAMKKGYRIAIISGAYSESVKRRFESLRVSDVFLGVEKKIEVFDEYLSEHNIDPQQVLFMGTIYRIMRSCGKLGSQPVQRCCRRD